MEPRWAKHSDLCIKAGFPAICLRKQAKNHDPRHVPYGIVWLASHESIPQPTPQEQHDEPSYVATAATEHYEETCSKQQRSTVSSSNAESEEELTPMQCGTSEPCRSSPYAGIVAATNNAEHNAKEGKFILRKKDDGENRLLQKHNSNIATEPVFKSKYRENVCSNVNRDLE